MLAAMDLAKDRPTTVKSCLKVMSAFIPVRAATEILSGCKQIIERPT
jgi:hypothetical protein